MALPSGMTHMEHMPIWIIFDGLFSLVQAHEQIVVWDEINS